MATPVKPKVSLSEWDHNSYSALEPNRDGNYVTSDTCLIAAGPPLLSQTGGIASNVNFNGNLELLDTTAYPIGLIQGFNVSQNRQHTRVYEVGSNYDYIISGRSVGTLTVGKIYYSAASLMRVLYAYYGTTGAKQIQALYDSPLAAAEALNDVYISPGSERIFTNMFSDLFRNPLGILIVMLTTQYNTLGAFYHQRCMIHGHAMTFDANGVIIQENCTLSFSNIAPVALESTSLLAAIKNFAGFFDLTGTL